jgi:DNA uptake protein ComE-like DNA-binding protein
MKKTLIEYFHFTRAERNGALVLSCICLTACLYPVWLRRSLEPVSPPRQAVFVDQPTPVESEIASEPFDFNPNTASFEDLVRLGLPERTAHSICNYRSKGGAFRAPEDFKKIYTLTAAEYERLKPFIQLKKTESKHKTPPAEVFDFDPNGATVSELERLGLSPKISERIVRYREKGGRFRKPEDFQKIYGMRAADYERLAPFIQIKQDEMHTESWAAMQYFGGSVDVQEKKKQLIPDVDINAAGVPEWDALPGIGAKRAAGIIKYREKLGGFLRIEQVGEAWVLPDSVFRNIEPYLVLGTPRIQCVDLNTATAERFRDHPYISPSQARMLVRYREQHGPFPTVDAIEQIIPLRDPDWLKKIKPYLCAGPG